MPAIPVTEARRNLYRLVDTVNASHVPVHITGKRGDAVLVSEDDWRSIEETLYLLSLPGMRESIVAGLETPTDACDEDPDRIRTGSRPPERKSVWLECHQLKP